MVNFSAACACRGAQRARDLVHRAAPRSHVVPGRQDRLQHRCPDREHPHAAVVWIRSEYRQSTSPRCHGLYQVRGRAINIQTLPWSGSCQSTGCQHPYAAVVWIRAMLWSCTAAQGNFINQGLTSVVQYHDQTCNIMM